MVQVVPAERLFFVGNTMIDTLLKQMLRMLQAISQGTGGLPVVFPVHPRTAKNLRELEGQIPGLNYVDPQGYLEDGGNERIDRH